MMISPSLALPAVQRWGGLVYEAPAIGAIYAFSALGIAAAGTGTYLFKGTLTAVGIGTVQNLLQVDDGSTNNRYMFRNAGASASCDLFRVLAGVTSATSAGNLTAGAEFRAGMAVDGAGGVIMSLNGAATVSRTGGPTGGLTTLRVGNNSGGGETMAGSIALLRVLPGVVMADANLRAAVSAL